MIPLDDADLALLEINNTDPVVQRLIWEIRYLRDQLVSVQVHADELSERLDIPRTYWV